MELYLLPKRGPLVWFYFNVGTYEKHWKRIALDFYVRCTKKVVGLGFEKVMRESP
jgi:hypothetical protein